MAVHSTYSICITGPESTGKTTLVETLAKHFNAVTVPDVSRNYIAGLTQKYTYEDVLAIGKEIINAEDEALRNGAKLIISDNDLINIKIWLTYYNWEVPAWLQDAIAKSRHSLYLLCYIDIPWVPDTQRANPFDRFELFNHFEAALKALNKNYKVLTGSGLIRTNAAVKEIEKILIKNNA